MKKLHKKIIALALILILVLSTGGYYFLDYSNRKSPDFKTIQADAKAIYKDYYDVEDIDDGNLIVQDGHIFVFFHSSIPKSTKFAWEQDKYSSSEKDLISRNSFFGFVEMKKDIFNKYKMVNISTSNHDSNMDIRGISGGAIGGKYHVEYGIVLEKEVVKLEFYTGNLLAHTYYVGENEDYYLVYFNEETCSVYKNSFHSIIKVKMYNKDGKLLYSK